MAELFQNKILISGALGWACAQFLKMLIYSIMNKSFHPERLVGDGGMPSAHSATVSAMAAGTAVLYGLSSFEFALSSMFAFIVMHDAMNVRLVTGKQSVVINEMIEIFSVDHPMDLLSEEKLKEFVGHTPLQVICGCLIGICVGIVFCV